MLTIKKKLSSEAGVTLIEMIVVVVVIGIVVSLALLRSNNADDQLTRQNAARSLKTAFEAARFDSVKRRADSGSTFAYVRIQSATEFRLVTDNNFDGDLTDSGDTVVTTLPAGITLASDLTIPVEVFFNQRGEPTIANVSFVVCNRTCDFSNDTPTNANVIHVTPTGTVNMLGGGSAIPTFTPPNVSSVNTSTGIRSQTYIAP